jgi:BolA protein
VSRIESRPSAEQLRARLLQVFDDDDVVVEVRDDSHLHAGHVGATTGAGHYAVRIRSRRFDGLSLASRHRLVYDALRDWMPDRIHALAIDARSPDASPVRVHLPRR